MRGPRSSSWAPVGVGLARENAAWAQKCVGPEIPWAPASIWSNPEEEAGESHGPREIAMGPAGENDEFEKCRVI